jgi:uncharacterized protein (TIGR03083 family)
VNIGEHLTNLEDAGTRLGAAAASAGLDSEVPSCPDWVVRDLVRHQGGVHRWATGYVAGSRTEPWGADLEEVAGGWPADTDLLSWFAEGHARLLDVLRNADTDLVCWTFLAAPTPLAFWARRQAHETTVHRVDAELAAGWQPEAVPAAFAADGVDELLRGFVPRPRTRLRSDPARLLRISCTDYPGDWLVRIGPDEVTTTSIDSAANVGGTGAAAADCQVAGTASDLYLALWNRRPTADLRIDGDSDVLVLFTDQVKIG